MQQNKCVRDDVNETICVLSMYVMNGCALTRIRCKVRFLTADLERAPPLYIIF